MTIEKYSPDQPYPVGTVVSIGTSSEVTACNIGDLPVGVIIEILEDGVNVKLSGRVNMLVAGAIAQGTKIVAGVGYGVAIDPTFGVNADVFAVAMQDQLDGSGVHLIECALI